MIRMALLILLLSGCAADENEEWETVNQPSKAKCTTNLTLGGGLTTRCPRTPTPPAKAK